MKVFIAGDIVSTQTTEPLYKAGDVATLFGDVVDVLKECDVNFANLECALCEDGEPIKKYGPPLKACPETAMTMKKLGINLCGISNNHFFDYGKKGVAESFAALNAAELDTVGFGEDYEDSRKNYIVEKGGEKICFIAVCEHEFTFAIPNRMGCRPYDPYDTIWDIRHAKEECDRVIVIYHGGKEYCAYPSPRMRQAFQAMARNGADVIVGQHSHCICAYEQYEGAHLFYGQGNFNFIWDREDPDCWNSAIELLYDTKTNEITFIPTVQDKTIPGTRLAKGQQKEDILSYFAKLNQSMLDGSWKDGWHAFAEGESEFFYGAIYKACAPGASEFDHNMFGHLLMCEAHQDIWRELFPHYNYTNEV